jgi:Tfp pilus assembly protein PilV
MSSRGQIAVEAVIAVALLATATAALAQLAQNASRLQQQADGRCAATLAAENLLARIDGVPVGRVQDEAAKAAVEIERDSGCHVAIDADRFTAAEREGVHVRVSVTPRDGPVVTVHDWSLGPNPRSAAESAQEPSDAN